jgi:Cro/C1-type HTH DNA-binding domain
VRSVRDSRDEGCAATDPSEPTPAGDNELARALDHEPDSPIEHAASSLRRDSWSRTLATALRTQETDYLFEIGTGRTQGRGGPGYACALRDIAFVSTAVGIRDRLGFQSLGTVAHPPGLVMPRVKKYREEKFGVTRARRGSRTIRQYDVARMLGIHASRLSEYVRGTYEIPWYVQMDLCLLLECSPDDILGVADPSTYDLTDRCTRLTNENR